MADQDIAEQYRQAVEAFRREKDEFWRSDPDSPLPEEERAGFTGLKYFPPDYDMRVVALVERLPQAALVKLATTDGQTRVFERYATLRFTLAGQDLRLTAFRVADGDDEHAGGEGPLFIPFRDALAGKETYGAGRYLDAEEEPVGNGTDIVVTLDFNLAYNPYCAYNDAYSCPITPAENNLPIPIRAGEKVFH